MAGTQADDGGKGRLPAPEPDSRLTIAQASEVTGLSKRALARRIERGQIPATKTGGLRYVEARHLAEAGLLDLRTGMPPAWARERIHPEVVAREVVNTLVEQSIELHELRSRLQELREESRRDDLALREEIERARQDREDLRRALREADERIAELRKPRLTLPLE